ncbi:HdeD family acid-resistance protein [Desulfocastanea catecholica]
MFLVYGKYWWLFLLRGTLATLFGLLAIFLPGITLEVMTIFLGAFLVVDGFVSFFVSMKGRGRGLNGGVLLLEGLLGIAVGVFTLIWPGITVLAIVLLVAFWAMMTGVLEIIAAVSLRNEIQGEWLLGLSGILSILFSVILFVNPGIGAVTLIWLIGVYAIVFGAAMIFLGLRLRNHNVIINL